MRGEPFGFLGFSKRERETQWRTLRHAFWLRFFELELSEALRVVLRPRPHESLRSKGRGEVEERGVQKRRKKSKMLAAAAAAAKVSHVLGLSSSFPQTRSLLALEGPPETS